MVNMKASLACGLQNCMKDFLHEDRFSDFTVVINDTSFKCHRLILSACSGFFQGLFRSNMQESQDNRVILNDITENAFEVILSIIYTGEELIANDNIIDVWAAAVQLQIGYLIKECEAFVIRSINEDNCFDLLRLAKVYSVGRVQAACLRSIAVNFGNMMNTDNLLQLSFDDFYRVVDDEYLSISSEDVVLKMILKWVQYDTKPKENVKESVENTCSSTSTVDAENTKTDNESVNEETTDLVPGRRADLGCSITSKTTGDCGVSIIREDRRHYLGRLIPTCRLYHANLSYLDDLLKNSELLHCNTEVENLIRDAIKFHHSVKRGHNSWPKAATYRLSSNMRHVMVFWYSRILTAYELNNGRLHFGEMNPIYTRNVLDFCVLDNEIYLLAENVHGEVHLFTYTQERSWSSSIFSRTRIYEQSVLLPHNQHLYCLCRIQNSDANFIIKRCELGTRDFITNWSHCYKINGRTDAVVGFNQCIIIFGTTNVTNSEAHCYDTETGNLHTVTIDGTSHDMINFYHQDDLYLLQRGGTVWKVVISNDVPVTFERICNIWDFDCDLKGCVVYRDQLFVFCDDPSIFDTGEHLVSVPGIARRVVFAHGVRSDFHCHPMVVKLPLRMEDEI